MTNNKNNTLNKKIKKEDKKSVKPGDIAGKIDIKDTRERRDGPGGN